MTSIMEPMDTQTLEEPDSDVEMTDEEEELINKAKNVLVIKQFQDSLKDILAKAKPLDDEKSSTKDVAKDYQMQLLKAMVKLDPLFEKMYQNKSNDQKSVGKITGSVKQSLKVYKPNEYDVNVPLRLPLREGGHSKVVISEPEEEEYASWYYCSFPGEEWEWPVPRRLQRRVWRSLFQENKETGVYTMRSDSVRSWMQGLVYRAIKEANLGEILKESRGGPAVTLFFKVDGIDVSMDFVAVLELDKTTQWKPKFGEEFDVETQFLVPVAPRVAKGSPLPPNGLFRGDFPEIEAKILEDRGCTKEVIRLFKILKLHNRWKPIASYYMQNLCTNWIRDKSGQELDQNQLGRIFIELLGVLEQALRDRHLPMRLFPDCNLFVKLDQRFCDNVANRLKRYIRRLTFATREDAINKEHMQDILEKLFMLKNEVDNAEV